MKTADEKLVDQLTTILEKRKRTCITCDFWNGPDKETCQLVNQRPPAHIIAYGCEKFLEEIPF